MFLNLLIFRKENLSTRITLRINYYPWMWMIILKLALHYNQENKHPAYVLIVVIDVSFCTLKASCQTNLFKLISLMDNVRMNSTTDLVGFLG